MPVPVKYKIVDRDIWCPANAAKVLPFMPRNDGELPTTSYVVGEERIEEVAIFKEHRVGTICAVEDVIWPMGGDCAASNGSIFQLDVIAKAASRDALFNVVERLPQESAVIIDQREATRTIPEAIYLNLASKLWGWRLLSLASLTALQEAVKDVIGDRRIPLLRGPKRPLTDADFEALEMIFGYRPEVITVTPGEFPIRVGKLWFAYVPVEGANNAHMFCDELYQSFQRGFNVAAPLPANPLRGGVYLTRRDTQRRPVTNDAEVEAFMAERGITALTMAPLSMHERIEEMATAKIVAGAVGSNTFNILFAAPGGWTIEFVPHDWASDMNGLIQLAYISSAVGRRHISVPTPRPPVGDASAIFVPLDRLERALQFIQQVDPD